MLLATGHCCHLLRIKHHTTIYYLLPHSKANISCWNMNMNSREKRSQRSHLSNVPNIPLFTINYQSKDVSCLSAWTILEALQHYHCKRSQYTTQTHEQYNGLSRWNKQHDVRYGGTSRWTEGADVQIYTCYTLFHQYFKCRNNVTINACLVGIKALLIYPFKDQLHK